MDRESSPLYQTPAVPRPTTEELKELAQRAHLRISPEDLEQYKSHISHLLLTYDRVNRMVEPTQPVNKYPTSTGCQPPASRNPYNAWCRFVEIEGAPSGKLSGKTLAIKDNYHIAGVPMTCGSNLLRGFVSSYTATTVTRILDAGGRIKGKATCEDLCWCGSSYTPATGPVLNPFDVTRSAGGSSSGSAVLVATGEVDMALGSDTGGSVRLPSCWCGTVGLKPTYGLVPFTGIMSLDPTLDHSGPMTRTVYECAQLLEVIAGYDGGLDPCQPSNLNVVNYTQHLTGDVKGLRVGLLKEGFDDSEADVAETVRNAANSLKQLGVTVEEFSTLLHDKLGDLAFVVVFEGAYDMYRNGGETPLNTKGFKDTATGDFLFNASRSVADTLSPAIKMDILFGSYVREKCGTHFYTKSLNLIRDLTAAYNEFFERYDVIILPTIKYKPVKLPIASITVAENCHEFARNTANTFPYNATGYPALTINAGFSDTEPRLPIGMMMVGRHFEDATVLRLAHAYEQLRDSTAAYSDVEKQLLGAMKSAKI